GARLRDVIELELKPYQAKKLPIAVSGPNVLLLPRAALSLGLAFHELVTNAAKHGAIARQGMKLNVNWSLEAASDQHLVIRWDEAGGRDVKKPKVTSFGMNLIRLAITQELSAKVEVDFKRDGMRCTIRIPTSGTVAEATSDNQP